MSFLKKILPTTNSTYTSREIIGWLWRVWRDNMTQATLNAVIDVAEVAVSLSQVAAVKNAIDVASGYRDGSIYWAVGIIALLILARFALNIASIWIKNILGIKAQNRMQQKMLDRILRSEWHGKEDHHSGDVMNRLEQDVQTIMKFLTETIPSTLGTLVMFVGAFLFLMSMDSRLAMIIVAMIPVFFGISKIYVTQMRRLSREVRQTDSEVQSLLQETVQNRMLVKVMENDQMMVDKLEDVHSTLRQKVAKRASFSVFSSFIIQLGFSCGYLVAFLWSAIRLSNHTLTFGGMTAFLQLVSKIQSPARQLMKFAPAIVQAFTSAERLMELEESPLEEQGDSIRMEGNLGIRLNDVSFQYADGDHPVIDHISFDFLPGTCTAIMGETGSGKTTLTRMLLGLLRPTSGSATIYNNKVEHDISPLLRCNLVYVPQGNTLMSGTIRENLLMGNANATEEEMTEALKTACADFVLSLPEGIDSPCTEDGGGLSEGQAQRIAVARALLRNRQIMIFDESTSALDMNTEKQLLHNILSTKDKTVIFITHRKAVVDYCDHILTVENT